VAKNYELSGGHIINVMRHCGLSAAKRGANLLVWEDFQDGIKLEYTKMGRIFR
jgi:hypothetical protein